MSLAQGSHRGIAPFLIQDVTPREERIPQAFDHKNGAIGIGTVTVAVGELTAVQQWYDAVLGHPGTNITNKKLQTKGVRYLIGPHQLDFLMPLDPQSPLTNWLRKFGSSPYAAALHSNPPIPKALDSKLTHGANLLFA